MFRLCSLISLLAGMAKADATGPLRVIDGDTIAIGDVTIRLFGIDAPEGDQPCWDTAGDMWPCGAWVTGQVRDAYDGQVADCVLVELDRYGRDVSRCAVGGRNLAEAIVLNGWATAFREYSWDYDLAEKTAQIAGLGIWAGSFDSPAAFRAADAPLPQVAPGECLIKGNISDAGQIYHQPGDASYDDTRINIARGERWFCSVEEALLAGWRAARN
jgi:endonuclease YncB( thermonuclease family)